MKKHTLLSDPADILLQSLSELMKKNEISAVIKKS
jgi:hypothetical protein